MKKLLAITIGLLFVTVLSARGPKVKVLEEELLFSGKYAPQYHASTIAEMPDGDLLVACFGGSKEGAADVATWMIRKKKGDRFWGEQYKIMDAIRLDKDNYLGAYNPVLFQLPDYAGGETLLFTKYGKNGSFGSCVGYIQRSNDGGYTWTEAEKLGAMADGTVGPDKNQPIMIGNRILAPSEGPNPKLGNKLWN